MNNPTTTLNRKHDSFRISGPLSIHSLFRWILAGLLLSCSGMPEDPNPSPRVATHPFLIVKKEQFAELRNKAEQEPWKSMKADAISRSEAGISSGSNQNAYALQYFIGAAALAYILDEENAQIHADRVRDVILNQYAQLEVVDGNVWGKVVPPLGSIFVAILSLDIVYDALTEEEIQQCEAVFSDHMFTISRVGAWDDARRGTHGVWDIYTGRRTEPDDDYYEGIMHQITEDGVSPVTIHYAWERLGGGDSRISKAGYMDVLEFTGIDQRYYNNERLQKFQRWLFGSSLTTAKQLAIIGDMLPGAAPGHHLLHLRAGNFDEEAAGYTAWLWEGEQAKGHILSYILPKTPLPEAQVPQSRWFANGGAFFREKADDPAGLHAVLYNIKGQDEWHTHQETNGLALSGYGNRLLVNGGRLGEPVRAAALNNTLTINGEDHVVRFGRGIIEGFTTQKFDYACGDDGTALSNDEHFRSLILVHADAGANAYALVFDEVDADPGEQVHNYLHPANESQLIMHSSGEHYEAKIDHEEKVGNRYLSFFYISPPTQVNIEKVASAVPDRYPGYPDHNRLEAIYPTDQNGDTRILTLMYPFKQGQTHADFSRISGNDYSGGLVQHSSQLQDVLLTSAGDQQLSYNNLTFQAKAVLVRSDAQMPLFYFVKHGVYLSRNAVGFEADAPVSIYVRGTSGAVASTGTHLTLKGPWISSVSFTPPANVLAAGGDSIRVELNEGTYHFQ